MYVLGLNSVFHESAACLLYEGEIVAASEEERFSRVKHAKTPTADNPHQLPYRAIHACLEAADIDLGQVGYIGYSSNPSARRRFDAQFDPFSPNRFVDNIESVPDVLRVLGYQGEFAWVDHHLAHAASAFYASPFEEAAVLAVDGIGDDKTTAGYYGVGERLNLVKAYSPPNSLGFLWELLSMFMGFDIYDATKIMGLAAYGDPDRYAKPFRRLLRSRPHGGFAVNNRIVKFDQLDYLTPSGYFGGLQTLFGVKKREPGEELSQEYMDIAACLQEATDEVLLHLARHLHERTGSTNLCLAGGVALNCVSNQRIFERGPFEQLYVQPAAHDAGTAIGAATYIWRHLLGNKQAPSMSPAYLGPEFSNEQIEAALRRRGLSFTRSDNIERDVAAILAGSEIVGWFQGRMEIGPRALGNRSLLADPRNPDMREILNHKVKHREYFRPFAPSVLAEEAENWFRIEKPTSASDFMLMAYRVHDEMQPKIPAVLHADGTSRIQTVRPEANPRYHRLISEFNTLTGVPIVLNTSFNDSEPIVCAPDDAIDTFLKTRIDHLAIGDFLVTKRDNTQHQPELEVADHQWERLCPEVGPLLNGSLDGRRLSRIEGMPIVTDRLDEASFDQVLPLYAEQQFFLDEMPRDRVAGARALEIGVGSGVLTVAAAKAGAASVVGLETNPRALELAELNRRLNRCPDIVELRPGDEDIYAPLRGEKFDYVFSNPPSCPTTPGVAWRCHSDGGHLGLGVLEKILGGLDEHLTPDGYAQVVAVCLGTSQEPKPLCEMAAQLLAGKLTVHVNPAPYRFLDQLRSQLSSGSIDEGQARQLARTALDNGCTHSLLVMLHYERRGPRGVVVKKSAKRYEYGNDDSPAVEPI